MNAGYDRQRSRVGDEGLGPDSGLFTGLLFRGADGGIAFSLDMDHLNRKTGDSSADSPPGSPGVSEKLQELYRFLHRGRKGLCRFLLLCTTTEGKDLLHKVLEPVAAAQTGCRYSESAFVPEATPMVKGAAIIPVLGNNFRFQYGLFLWGRLSSLPIGRN